MGAVVGKSDGSPQFFGLDAVWTHAGNSADRAEIFEKPGTFQAEETAEHSFFGERQTVKILVIVPAYNESAIIAQTVNMIRDSIPQADILVVNDGSADNTLQVLRDCGVNYLNLRTNLGIGGAVQSGYQYARENNYDYAVQIDGDGQHDPAYIQGIINRMEAEGVDVGIGSRFIDHRGFQSSSMRRAGIRFLSSLIHLTSGARIKDVTSGYRVVNRKYIEEYAKDYADDYPEPDAIMTVAFRHGKIAEYPVEMRGRTTGVSSISPRKSVYYMVKVSLSILMYRLMRRSEG